MARDRVLRMTDKRDPDFMGCNRSQLEINESMKSDTLKLKSDAEGIKLAAGVSRCEE